MQISLSCRRWSTELHGHVVNGSCWWITPRDLQGQGNIKSDLANILLLLFFSLHLQLGSVAHPVDHEDDGDEAHHHDNRQDHLAGDGIDLVQLADVSETIDVLAATAGIAAVAHRGTDAVLRVRSLVAHALMRLHVTILAAGAVLLCVTVGVAGVRV